MVISDFHVGLSAVMVLVYPQFPSDGISLQPVKPGDGFSLFAAMSRLVFMSRTLVILVIISLYLQRHCFLLVLSVEISCECFYVKS